MAIGSVMEKGSQIIAYDENNRQLFSRSKGQKPGDGLKGYTNTTVSIQNGSQLLTYDERHLIPPSEARIGWLSVRPGYWALLQGEDDLHGIMCLQFGVGSAGLGWLTRLADSEWFRGLEPRPEDLSEAGGPPGSTFFDGASLPTVWYAAVAIPDEAEPGERAAAVRLVAALRERADPLGRKLPVVATFGASGDPALARSLLGVGAFVIRAAAGSSDHLHHFPLRAAVAPREGQLIGVDLDDILQTWQPGSMGDLHDVPTVEPAAGCLPRSHRCSAISIGFHLDAGAPGNALVVMNDFAMRCRERYLPDGGTAVFTNTNRLDGRSGSADLLLIRNRIEDRTVRPG